MDCGYSEKYQKFSTENFQFLQLGKNLYITWACFRNEETRGVKSILCGHNPHPESAVI